MRLLNSIENKNISSKKAPVNRITGALL